MIVESKLTYEPGISILLKWGVYENGRTALEGVDPSTGEPICKFSVNVPGRIVVKGQVTIKDWAENEGAFRTLTEAGVVQMISFFHVERGCTAYECKILKRE